MAVGSVSLVKLSSTAELEEEVRAARAGETLPEKIAAYGSVAHLPTLTRPFFKLS